MKSNVPLSLPPGSLDELSEKIGGGRLVCSIQELLDVVSDPAGKNHTIIAWLTDEGDAEVKACKIEQLFTRQLERWWNFCKSQWFNRGISDTEEEESAYVEAVRRTRQMTSDDNYLLSIEFDERTRQNWQDMRRFQEEPQPRPSSVYVATVEARLRPCRLDRRLQMKRDPREQDAWTNWLEYLSFEIQRLEVAEDCANSLRGQFLETWRSLVTREAKLDAVPPLCASRYTISTGRRYMPPFDPDPSGTAIRNFVKPMRRYSDAQTVGFYQNCRVNWAVREARALTAELAEEEAAAVEAKRVRREEARETRKRRRQEDDAGDETRRVVRVQALLDYRIQIALRYRPIDG